MAPNYDILSIFCGGKSGNTKNRLVFIPCPHMVLYGSVYRTIQNNVFLYGFVWFYMLLHCFTCFLKALIQGFLGFTQGFILFFYGVLGFYRINTNLF